MLCEVGGGDLPNSHTCGTAACELYHQWNSPRLAAEVACAAKMISHKIFGKSLFWRISHLPKNSQCTAKIFAADMERFRCGTVLPERISITNSDVSLRRKPNRSEERRVGKECRS